MAETISWSFTSVSKLITNSLAWSMRHPNFFAMTRDHFLIIGICFPMFHLSCIGFRVSLHLRRFVNHTASLGEQLCLTNEIILFHFIYQPIAVRTPSPATTVKKVITMITPATMSSFFSLDNLILPYTVNIDQE